VPVRVLKFGCSLQCRDLLACLPDVNSWTARYESAAGASVKRSRPLAGLLPNPGDPIGPDLDGSIVVRAVQAGIPPIAITRRMASITIDTPIGSIPLFRDVSISRTSIMLQALHLKVGTARSTLTITNRTVP